VHRVPRGEVAPRGERRAEPEGEAAGGGGRVGAPELHVVERERVEAVGARVGADEAAVAYEAERCRGAAGGSGGGSGSGGHGARRVGSGGGLPPHTWWWAWEWACGCALGLLRWGGVG
jgi:hypothetical protein